MELIFGFLPLPIAVGAIIVIGVGGFLVKKFAKNSNVKAVTDQIVSAVITRERIDQTVEAVLAKLRVSPELADKIGDSIADIVVAVMNVRSKVASKSAIVATSITEDSGVNPGVIAAIIGGPTPLNDVIFEVAPHDVAANHDARGLVAAGVVKAYAAKTVL